MNFSLMLQRAAFVGVCSVAWSAQAAAPVYRVVDLGTLPGATQCSTAAISDAGHVVGRCTRLADEYFNPETSYIWHADTGMQELATPGFDIDARGVNSDGAVVGYKYNWVRIPNGGGKSYQAGRPFLWTAAQGFVDIPVPGECGEGAAQAINDAGQVVGYAEMMNCDRRKAPHERHAFLWSAGEGLVDLNTGLHKNIDATPTDINNRNQVAAFYRLDETFIRYFATRADLETGHQLPLPGPQGDGHATIAYAVNDWGDVVGYSQKGTGPAELTRAVLWSETLGVINLHTNQGQGRRTTFSIARGINNQREIVGTISQGLPLGGFYWSAGTGTVHIADLIDPADPLRDAMQNAQPQPYAINHSGQVVLSAMRGAMLTPHAYMLTPVGAAGR